MTKTKDAPKDAAKEDKAPGIGAIATAAILAGKSNEEALAAVKAAHPDANTGMASINWYRNKLRSESATLDGSKGKKPVPTSREMKKAADGDKPATSKGKDKDKGKGKGEKDPLA